jgi:hypothetical protein
MPTGHRSWPSSALCPMALNWCKRKCASTPVSDGVSSISQSFSPDGLRRSAFNATPFGTSPTGGSLNQFTALLALHRLCRQTGHRPILPAEAPEFILGNGLNALSTVARSSEAVRSRDASISKWATGPFHALERFLKLLAHVTEISTGHYSR